MTDERITEQLERRLTEWCHATAPLPPPGLADRCLGRTAAVEQRRGWGGLGFGPALAAAAVVLIAIVVGLRLGNLLPVAEQPPVGSAPVSASPTPSANPTPSSPPPASPEPTVTPSPETFPDGNRCRNETLGFEVAYPADWFANEAVEPDVEGLDPVEACRYFSDEPMEIRPNAGLPATVAIVFNLVEEEPPASGNTLSSEEVTVAGRPATVTEIEGTGDGPFFAEGDFSYGYRITLENGQFLLAATHYANEGDYEGHKEVLDRMMETLDLIDP